jgi:hypothetical protein
MRLAIHLSPFCLYSVNAFILSPAVPFALEKRFCQQASFLIGDCQEPKLLSGLVGTGVGIGVSVSIGI